MSANEKQVAGEHYKAGYQHWDWSDDIRLSPMPYQVTKYLTRWKKKNGVQDLEKAKHFLDKYIELKNKEAQNRADCSNRFMNENNVDYYERDIIIKMMWFEDGHIAYLEQASEGIQRLINTLLAEKYLK
jgi:hypothetical protein